MRRRAIQISKMSVIKAVPPCPNVAYHNVEQLDHAEVHTRNKREDYAVTDAL